MPQLRCGHARRARAGSNNSTTLSNRMNRHTRQRGVARPPGAGEAPCVCARWMVAHPTQATAPHLGFFVLGRPGVRRCCLRRCVTGCRGLEGSGGEGQLGQGAAGKGIALPGSTLWTAAAAASWWCAYVRGGAAPALGTAFVAPSLKHSAELAPNQPPICPTIAALLFSVSPLPVSLPQIVHTIRHERCSGKCRACCSP